MVAIVHGSKSIRDAFYYNDEKLQLGQAELILAENYLKDSEKLSSRERLDRITKQAAKNENIKHNCLHVSLNFDEADKPDKERLKEIAKAYMEMVGFTDQPYLVYRHHDAGHAHVHIVSTNIESDGSRISMHNFAKTTSLKAALAIEKEFALTQAQGKKHDIKYELLPINAQKISYGKTQTKKAISNVLHYVIPNYKYSSLTELNAVLRQYNLLADPGGEGSRIAANKGLLYHVLDDKGNRVGVPIKASLIANKPTLKSIEARFEANEKEKERFKLRTRNAIDFSIRSHRPKNFSELSEILKKQSVTTVLRQNAAGFIYGVTYIDHKTKCVLDGSDLGKNYAAKGVQERLSAVPAPQHESLATFKEQTPAIQQNQPSGDLAKSLLMPTGASAATPLITKKKRKNKNQRLSPE